MACAAMWVFSRAKQTLKHYLEDQMPGTYLHHYSACISISSYDDVFFALDVNLVYDGAILEDLPSILSKQTSKAWIQLQSIEQEDLTPRTSK
jgi:hypothetical protein